MSKNVTIILPRKPQLVADLFDSFSDARLLPLLTDAFVEASLQGAGDKQLAQRLAAHIARHDPELAKTLLEFFWHDLVS